MTEQEPKPPASALGGSRGHLREVEWTTASVLIFSSDGRLLMGQKEPVRRRGRLDVWHLPGGEVEEGESLESAAMRKAELEVGLRLAPEQLTPVPFIGEDETVKTLATGETVWCRIKLNRFEVRLDQKAAQLEARVQPGDDLVALRWFSREELADAKQIPGVRAFFIRAGYIEATSAPHAIP